MIAKIIAYNKFDRHSANDGRTKNTNVRNTVPKTIATANRAAAKRSDRNEAA